MDGISDEVEDNATACIEQETTSQYDSPPKQDLWK